MQQLSLFDFGEEAPKPEKKNKASKSGIEQSDSATDKGNPSELKAEDIDDSIKVNDLSSDEQSATVAPIDSMGEEHPEPEGIHGQTTKEAEERIDKKEISVDSKTEQSGVAQPDNSGFRGPEIQKTQQATQPDQQQIVPNPGARLNESEILNPPPSTDEANAMEAAQNDNDGVSGDVIFSNEQVRVKKYVVKSVETVSVKMPPRPLQEDVPPNDEVAMETEARELPELDTSFSPDDFASQETDQKEKANQQENIAEASLLTDDEIIHSDIKSDSEANERIPATGESVNNQDNRSENSARKPFYVEDQTVPVRKRGRKSFKEIDAEVDLINIPSDEELFQKQYYPISVVAKWFRVNNSLLRFWENEFKILKPKKNKKGDRFFRPEDVKNLQLIYYLLRQKKLTINGAIKHLKSYKEQTEVNMQLIQTLNDFKGFLLELKAATEK